MYNVDKNQVMSNISYLHWIEYFLRLAWVRFKAAFGLPIDVDKNFYPADAAWRRKTGRLPKGIGITVNGRNDGLGMQAMSRKSPHSISQLLSRQPTSIRRSSLSSTATVTAKLGSRTGKPSSISERGSVQLWTQNSKLSITPIFSWAARRFPNKPYYNSSNAIGPVARLLTHLRISSRDCEKRRGSRWVRVVPETFA